MNEEYRTQLALALKAGFIDESIGSDDKIRPKLLSNNFELKNKVLSMLESELMSCETFMFSVAFVTKGGITVLLNALKQLEEKGVKGRLLTSTYNYFNDPMTFNRLLELSEVLEVRIFEEDRDFHAKGYIFKNGQDSNFIVGSSNLTQNALTKNLEWNIKINSQHQGALIKELEGEFEYLWETSEALTEEWISEYEKKYNESKIININRALGALKKHNFKLNRMQWEALDALKRLRSEGKTKALLISATGTGKTYLSAFDVEEFKPKRFLFVIHRENVARRAMESYRNILGKEVSMGLLSGNHHLDEKIPDYIFATIQTLSKDEYLEQLPPMHFDYIVIDEVHRAGAKTYEKVLNHFTPKFLLGMSATPERTDGYNIAEVFDFNIAYEIRLQQAMKYDLLCPFHYFAISDIVVDGELISDTAEFNNLVSDVRVGHIIDSLKYYSHSGNRPRGLIFCSRNEEAEKLSRQFNLRGYRTVALSGVSSEESRRVAIDRLEQYEYEKGLDYIFTVDIFNEGIDIPQVNQIVMLRPTQSSIVFIQQLGRGLRKIEDKEYVVVLDFIGNYQNNYMIPIALSGDRSYNKDYLRRFAAEGNDMIEGSSTIHFDPITKKRIFDSINKIRFSRNLLKKEYKYLKQIVGRVPTMTDFYEHGAIDLQILHERPKKYTYLELVSEIDSDSTFNPDEIQQGIISFISKELTNSIRPHEIVILKYIINHNELDLDKILEELTKTYSLLNQEATVKHACRLLSANFFTAQRRERYKKYIPLDLSDDQIWTRTSTFNDAIKDEDFREKLEDILEYCLLKYRNEYHEVRDHLKDGPFVLYKKYSRKDVCRLLKWDKDESATIFGYTVKYDKDPPECPIFVTYKKEEGISSTLKYDDRFLNRYQFSWLTRNNITLRAKEAVAIGNQDDNDMNIHLFIKKANDEGSEHYYLGRMNKRIMLESTIRKNHNTDETLPIVNVIFDMENPVSQDIYDYLTAGEE